MTIKELKGYWKIEPTIEFEEKNLSQEQIDELIHDKLMDVSMNPNDYIGFDEVEKKERIDKIRVFYADEIKDDVLDRLNGLEDLSNTDELVKTHLFALDTIEKLLDDENDDTNETTKNRIAELISNMTERWLMIIWR